MGRVWWLLVVPLVVGCGEDESVAGSGGGGGMGAMGGAGPGGSGGDVGGSGGDGGDGGSAQGGSGGGGSIRFFGNGVNDIDRAKIRIDDETNGDAGPPHDVGATDFTIELWMRAASGDNTAGVHACDSYSWINGNILVDRDRFNQGRAFGVSIGGGLMSFGVINELSESETICGTTDVLDDAWHHVAVQRRRSDGLLWIWIDGALDASADGPDGDISYPDAGVPGDYCGGPCDFSDPFLVIAAEKHDAGSAYPSYSGFVDELRISTVLRYDAPFTPPSAPFTADANTAGLYHFDEGQGETANDSATPPVHAELRVGGTPTGPLWTPGHAVLNGNPMRLFRSFGER